MKKTLTAAAVCAMLSPLGAMADASLYSSLRLGLTTTDDSDPSLTSHSSRFGIKASRDIGGGNSVIGRYEWGVDGTDAVIAGAGDSDGDGQLDALNKTNRLSYIGFKGGWGQVQVGSVWSPYFNIAGAKGCDPFTLACNSSMTFRLGDSITYSGSFGGFGVAALAQLNDGISRTQFGASFDIAGFGIGAAVDAVDGGETTTGIGVTYSIAGIGLKYLLTTLDDADDTQHALTASYSSGPHSVTGEFWSADNADDDELMLGYLWGGIPKTKLGIAFQTGATDTTRLYLRHDF